MIGMVNKYFFERLLPEERSSIFQKAIKEKRISRLFYFLILIGKVLLFACLLCLVLAMLKELMQ